MELVYSIAGAVILILLLNRFSSHGKESPDPSPDMESLAEYIDSSLKGYPERYRHKGLENEYGWTCHSRLFTIQIHLDRKTPGYRFRVYLFRDLPYQFSAKRTIAKKQMKIVSSKGAATKELIRQKEIAALLKKLDFYDKIEIYQHGVSGTKKFRTLEDLHGWHQALGATITFTRYLLNSMERKIPTEVSEAVCPYCKGTIAETDQIVSCSQCRTRHHMDCWNETDRCSVFGCGGKSELNL